MEHFSADLGAVALADGGERARQRAERLQPRGERVTPLGGSISSASVGTVKAKRAASGVAGSNASSTRGRRATTR
jgi:hypothetical protein